MPPRDPARAARPRCAARGSGGEREAPARDGNVARRRKRVRARDGNVARRRSGLAHATATSRAARKPHARDGNVARRAPATR
jgi:hypothetical protein